MSEQLRDFEISDEQYSGLIAGVANHEAKALTLAVMGSMPGDDGYFSAANLDKVMRDIQGPNPGWETSMATPFKYCDESMGPIGAVTKSAIKNERGRLVYAYALTPLGKEHGLAMAGLVLDWSLKYPDLSIQVVLGSTNSKTSNRAPIHRLAILESILTAGSDGVSYSDIALDHPHIEGIGDIVENLRRGAFSKLISITTNQKDYSPTLTVLDPLYRGKTNFEHVSSETQAIYKTMQYLSKNEITTINLNDFIDKLVELYPELSAKKIRNIITQSTNRQQHRVPGMKIDEEGRPGLGQKKSSSIKINAEYEDALCELVSDLSNFRTGDKHSFYRQRALEIVRSPEACAEIMAKAAHNSMKVRVAKSAQPIGKIIVGMLSESDNSLTAYDISNKLSTDYQLPICMEAVRNHLNTAVKAGLVKGEKYTQEKSGRPKTLTYYQAITD